MNNNDFIQWHKKCSNGRGDLLGQSARLGDANERTVLGPLEQEAIKIAAIAGHAQGARA